VSFPSFTNSASDQTAVTSKSAATSTPMSIYRPSQHHHASLFKRVLQQKQETAAAAESGPDSGGASTSGVDRAGDMKKIDTFLRLVNQLLVWPFTDSSRPVQTLNSTSSSSSPPASILFKQPPSKVIVAQSSTTTPTHPPSSSSSPSKYDDLKHNFSNLENIFALSMIIKHCHFFANASFQGAPILAADSSNESSLSDKIGPGGDAFVSSFRNRSAHKFHIDISPLDELRT
jgi:hypothetical protein